MNAPNPTRQVTLIGKTRAGGNVGKAGLSAANQFDGTLQPQMNNVTVWRDADRSGEHAGEVKRAAPRYGGQRLDRNLLIEVRKYIFLKPLEHDLT